MVDSVACWMLMEDVIPQPWSKVHGKSFVNDFHQMIFIKNERQSHLMYGSERPG